MLVTLKRQEFESMDQDTLVWACIEPTIHKVRGKNHTVKSQVYDELSPGQRALFLFWVLYGHSKSITEFFGIVFLYLDKWSEFKTGIRYFGDNNMFRVYKEIEKVFEAENHGKGNKPEIPIMVIENVPLFATVSRQYKTYNENVPETIKRIGAYIRSNPDEFVQLEE